MRRHRSLARPLRLALFGLAMSVVGTGCLKLDVDVAVREDDTVDGTAVLGIAKQVAEGLEGDITSQADTFTGTEGLTAEAWEDENFVGTQVTLDALTFDGFRSFGDGLTGATGSDGTGGMQVVREGDTFRFTATLDFSDGELTSDGGDGPDLGFLFGEADLRVRVTFPGEVLEADDAARIDGTTVTWVPEFGERLEIFAVASAVPGGGAGGGFPIALVGIGLVLIGVVGLIAFVLLRRRRSDGVIAVAAVGAAPPPPLFEPAAPRTSGTPQAPPTMPAPPVSPVPPVPPVQAPPGALPPPPSSLPRPRPSRHRRHHPRPADPRRRPASRTGPPLRSGA
jgi:hypothetical protein